MAKKLMVKYFYLQISQEDIFTLSVNSEIFCITYVSSIIIHYFAFLSNEKILSVTAILKGGKMADIILDCSFFLLFFERWAELNLWTFFPARNCRVRTGSMLARYKQGNFLSLFRVISAGRCIYVILVSGSSLVATSSSRSSSDRYLRFVGSDAKRSYAPNSFAVRWESASN